MAENAKGTASTSQLLSRAVLSPRKFLLEPIVLVLTLYMSIIYGVVYLNFDACPVVSRVSGVGSRGRQPRLPWHCSRCPLSTRIRRRLHQPTFQRCSVRESRFCLSRRPPRTRDHRGRRGTHWTRRLRSHLLTQRPLHRANHIRRTIWFRCRPHLSPRPGLPCRRLQCLRRLGSRRQRVCQW